MAKPRVAAIWINYNSMHFIKISTRSITSLLEQNYENLRVIIVDNASTDGSYEKIKGIAETHKSKGVDVKIIRSQRNLGYAGAGNLGFKYTRDAKYVAIITNDTILLPHAISTLVDIAESLGVSGVQGILRSPKGSIDCMGAYITESYIPIPGFMGTQPPSHPVYVTYLDGNFIFMRREHVIKAMGDEKLFYDELFYYADDFILGLRMWSAGYKLIAYPIDIAIHNRSSSLGIFNPQRLYYGYRGISILAHLLDCETCNDLYLRLWLIRKTLSLLLRVGPSAANAILSAWRDGKKLAAKIRERYGPIVVTLETPLIRQTWVEKVSGLVLQRLGRINWAKIANEFKVA